MTIHIALHAWMWHVAIGFAVGFIVGGIAGAAWLAKSFPTFGNI